MKSSKDYFEEEQQIYYESLRSVEKNNYISTQIKLKTKAT